MRRSVIRRIGVLRGLLVSVAVFVALIVGVNALVGGVEEKSAANELDIVKRAVRRAALTCYAIEGRYPQTLDYLNAHYGLLYDQARYAVMYDAFSSVVMPDIRVVALDEERDPGEVLVL